MDDLARRAVARAAVRQHRPHRHRTGGHLRAGLEELVREHHREPRCLAAERPLPRGGRRWLCRLSPGGQRTSRPLRPAHLPRTLLRPRGRARRPSPRRDGLLDGERGPKAPVSTRRHVRRGGHRSIQRPPRPTTSSGGQHATPAATQTTTESGEPKTSSRASNQVATTLQWPVARTAADRFGAPPRSCRGGPAAGCRHRRGNLQPIDGHGPRRTPLLTDCRLQQRQRGSQ
jgi:hypothetical protein